jgi:hypothetical protein
MDNLDILNLYNIDTSEMSGAGGKGNSGRSRSNNTHIKSKLKGKLMQVDSCDKALLGLYFVLLLLVLIMVGNLMNTAEKGNSIITHTRIADKDANIYGGAYTIPKEELPVFHKLYYQHVFVNNRAEYLTEKQMDTECPLLVDFDFRYVYDVVSRQHTKEHIQDMILLYLEEIKQYFIFTENNPFDIFIFEKPNVNQNANFRNLTSKQIVKSLQLTNGTYIVIQG